MPLIPPKDARALASSTGRLQGMPSLPLKRTPIQIPCARQAHEKLTAMNDPAKGGSSYLQNKILAARNALVAEKPPPPPPEPPDSKASGAAGGDSKAA